MTFISITLCYCSMILKTLCYCSMILKTLCYCSMILKSERLERFMFKYHTIIVPMSMTFDLLLIINILIKLIINILIKYA